MNVTDPLASWVVAVAEWSFVLGAAGAIVVALLVSSRRKVPVIHYQLTRECGTLLLIACGSASAIAKAELGLMLSAGGVGDRVLKCESTGSIPVELSQARR